MAELTDEEVLERLASFKQYQHDGKRVPHKPLLVLLALGRLDDTGTSALRWSEAETRLADLIAEFGPPSRTGRPQSAAYPFTRLRADGIWEIDHDVPTTTSDHSGSITSPDISRTRSRIRYAPDRRFCTPRPVGSSRASSR